MMMNVNELIEEVTNQSVPLSQSLMKAKVLAKTVGSDGLFQWVSLELNGYPKSDVLPEGRKLKGRVFLIEDTYQGQCTFPLTFDADMPLEYQAHLTSYSCYDSLPSILAHLGNYSSLTFKVTLSDFQLKVLSYPYQQNGQYIVSGYYEFPIGAVNSIVEGVRQKLLDLLLDLLNAKVATNIQEEIVNNTIITNVYGNNNPINIAAGTIVAQHTTSNSNTVTHD